MAHCFWLIFVYIESYFLLMLFGVIFLEIFFWYGRHILHLLHCTKKWSFPLRNSSYLVTLTEEILNGKLHFRTVSARVFRLILRHFRINLSFCRYVSVMTRAGCHGRQLLCFRSLAKKALQHWYFVFLISFSPVGPRKWFLF